MLYENDFKQSFYPVKYTLEEKARPNETIKLTSVKANC